MAGLETTLGCRVPLRRPSPLARGRRRPDEESLRERIVDMAAGSGAARRRRSGRRCHQFERSLMLQTLDQLWKDHLANIDHLRQGIHLRGYAQKNPKQEYKREAFELFSDLLDRIKHEVVRVLSRCRCAAGGRGGRRGAAGRSRTCATSTPITRKRSPARRRATATPRWRRRAERRRSCAPARRSDATSPAPAVRARNTSSATASSADARLMDLEDRARHARPLRRPFPGRCCRCPASRSARAAGIKNRQRDLVLLVTCAPGTRRGGRFTQNRFCAAPVIVCREHLALSQGRRADACARGQRRQRQRRHRAAAACTTRAQTCAAVGQLIGCAPEEVLPFSTGVIIEPLPVDRVVAALPAALAAAARAAGTPPRSAIMTTDTVPKGASRRVVVDGVPVTVTGIAKGAGMIHPNMATMLAFMATDAPVAADVLGTIAARGRRRLVQRRHGRRRHLDQRQLRHRRDRPRAAAADPLDVATRALRRCARRSRRSRSSSRRRSCATARARPSSSTIRVEGGRSADECRRVALGIAHSPLVKTAFFASDPNLGRIISRDRQRRPAGSRSIARVVLAGRRAGGRPRRADRRPIARRTGSG